MRAAFLLAVLFLAAFYTYMAFASLSFLSVIGRLGPGFFPRIIGIALVVTCLSALYLEYRNRTEADALSSYWRVTLVVALLSAIFVAVLNVLGGVLSMVVFLLASLSILNSGRHLQNVLIALILPGLIYLLFDVWLNASLPAGMIRWPL